MISHINLNMKRTGKPTAANLHGGFDEAGAGNVMKASTFNNAPVLDPTKISFKRYILVSLTQSNTRNVEKSINQFKEALRLNDIDLFCTALKSLLANIPYQLHIGNEAYYHSLLHVLVDLLGYGGQSEISSSKGRIDLTITTKKSIFVFELKFETSPQKALDQIMEQRYYEKYLRFNKSITLVGLTFNVKDKKPVLDWIKKDL